MGQLCLQQAIHTNLRDLQKEFSGVTILAYLDDVFLLGPLDQNSEYFQALKRMFCFIYLIVSVTKCEIFSPSGVPDASGIDLPENREGSMFLGTPICSAFFVESLCSEVA